MAKRSPRKQTKHDSAVKKSAEYYKQRGYKVFAAIPGYPSPETIDKRKPDVFAEKGKEKIIIEVETKDTIDKDKRQQEIFKNYADRRKNVRFWRKLVK